MSQVYIPGVGLFERTSIDSPWSNDAVVCYQTISLDPPARRISWRPSLLAVFPSFAADVLLGILLAT